MKIKNIFWGSTFLLGGIVLLMNTLGYFQELSVFTLLFSILLIAISIQSLFKLNFFGLFFPLAIITYLYRSFIGFEDLSIWILLGSALLGSIGCSLLFNRKPKVNINHDFHWDSNDKEYTDVEYTDLNNIYLDTKFGGSSKYINSDAFESATIKCTFGGMQVYFDQCTMKESRSVVVIDVNFGGLELYVPKNWRVENHTSDAFGGIDVPNQVDPNAPYTLIIKGHANFAGVQVYYV